MAIVNLSGTASAASSASGTLSIVKAVAGAVHPPGVTRADLDEVVQVLLQGIRESADADRIARQVEEQAPMFRQLARFLRTPNGVFVVLSVLLALASFVHDVVPDFKQDPPPAATAPGPTPAEVEQMVNDRIRELQQSGGELPDHDDTAHPDGPAQHS